MRHKKGIFLIIFFATNLYSQSFISPIDFVPTESNKEAVIEYIKKQVLDEYSAIGMDDPITLRMMENENLKSFKELTAATNIKLLTQVIETYCEIGMCNYSIILMMYNEELKASQQTLEW